MAADPQKTFAVVVGVEKYAAGSKWDLDGPASDASKFVEWLHSRQVPEENIFLYLSPLDKNVGLVRQGAKAATREYVYHALTTILPLKQDGTLLYLFWGGHGMITPDNKRLLFYADTTEYNIVNLDLNSLLVSLRSNFFPGFEQQIFFIDACANYVVDWRVYGTLPLQTFPGGDPLVTHEQFVCLATKPGEYAKNVTEQQTGLFSKVLRDELSKQKSDTWPPNMELLAISLAARFSKLRADGLAKQTPTHYWAKDWDSNERLLGEIPVAANKVGFTTATLTGTQRRALTTLLLACEAMERKGTRDIIIKDLRYAIRINVLRDHQNDLFDIRGMVDSCLNYAGGLHELVEVVRAYEMDSTAMQQADAFMEQVPKGL